MLNWYLADTYQALPILNLHLPILNQWLNA